MATWWEQAVTGLGNANAPFGFAPQGVAPSQEINPAYNSGMDMIGDIGFRMLANVKRNPLEAFGQSYIGAEEAARSKSKEAFAAQQMMMEADEKKKERARAEARQKWIDDEIAKLPVDQQGMARMLPEKFFGEQIEAQFPDANGSGSEVYGTVYFDEQTQQPYVLTKNGRMRAPEGLPPGAKIYDPYSMAYNKSRGTTTGREDAEAAVAAPGDIAAADIALGKIEELRTDPNRGIGTGKSAVFNAIPASPGYDYQTKVDEVTAGAFLTAIQQMRGLGALSNAEGQTARQAVTRIKTATSEEAFLDALADYEEIVMMGRERAKKRISPGASAPAPAADNNDPLGLR